MKKIIIILVVCLSELSFAQNVCTKENNFDDVNQISVNKCQSNASQSTRRNTSFNTRTLGKRYLNRRKIGSLNKSVNRTQLKSVKKAVNTIDILVREIEKPKSNIEFKLKEIQIITLDKPELPILKESKIISFIDVSNVPVFNNEKYLSNSFNQNMAYHIKSELRYPEAALVNKIEGEVLVDFVINVKGEVENIVATTNENNFELKKEAVRIIKSLPTFTPGVHNGKTVNVSYSFPMEFYINNSVIY